MAEEKIKVDAKILKDAQADSDDEKKLSKDELEAVAGGAARTLEDKNFGPVPEMPIGRGNCQFG